MKHGKKITIFLIDGDPNGRMACELSNWTGKAYKIPRIRVKDCVDRNDLQNTGVYLLLGKNQEGNDLAYIGEAENVFERLKQHLGQKEFWNETIVFISKDENLNKAHIKYLESRLVEIAKSTKRFQLENSITPTKSTISEADRAEMEEFLEHIKLLVNTLGYKIFEEKAESFSDKNQQKDYFFIKGARGANAKGFPTSEGFTVLKGSKMVITTSNSAAPYIKNKREDLISKGIIFEIDEIFEFKEDVIFQSPSTAGAVIIGNNINGLTNWKTENGLTLKEYESQINQNTDNNN